MTTYGLYQTFSSDMPDDDLNYEDKLYLKESIKTMTVDQKKAIFLLIIEHARLTEQFNFVPDNLVYPYGINQLGNNIEFNLDLLPIKLKWILFKFSKLMKNEI